MKKFDPYNALIPVFLHTKLPKRMRQFGTAVFFELHGEPYLLTAAHVTDDLKQGELLVPTSEGFLPIEGYLGFIDLPPEIRRTEDMTDIAYYRLTTRLAIALRHHFSPLPQTRSELIQSALELTVCSTSGHPATKGKKNENTYSSEIFSFRGVSAQAEIYEQLSLSPTASIILHFGKKRAVDLNTLAPFPTPSLKGVSGGGIFAWPRGSEFSDDWSLPMLVGIFHTYKEREGLIIGTSLLPILSAISLGKMKGFGGIR
jgi:hypothetical protein